MNKLIENYLDYLKIEKNYSDYTVDNYRQDIIEFMNYLEKESLNFKDLSYDDIRFFLMNLKDEKKDTNSTIDRKLSSLRSFYRYLVNEKIIKTNVFSLVTGLKKDKKLPRYFEYNELEELFNIPNKTSPLGQRDSLLLEMLYATGVRVFELVNIKLTDINQTNSTILILGKGNKERLLIMENIVKKHLILTYLMVITFLILKKVLTYF